MSKMVPGRMLGVRIGTRSLTELVSASEFAIRKGCESFIFACANPHSLVAARRDAEFREALEKSSAVVADGVGLLRGHDDGVERGGGQSVFLWVQRCGSLEVGGAREPRFSPRHDRGAFAPVQALVGGGEHPDDCRYPSIRAGRALGGNDGTEAGEVGSRE